MALRTTEQIAPEMLAQLISELTKLTTDQPTTVEIEEALLGVMPQVVHVLKTWITSRHLNMAHAHQAAKFAESHPQVAEVMRRLAAPEQALRQIAAIPTATAAEDEAFDEMERRSLHPVFQNLLQAVRPA